MIFQFLLAILSVGLYLFAPSYYDFTYCLICFIIFLINVSVGVIKGRKIEFFGFNLLFSMSFFACCFIYPIFIYNIDDSISLFSHGYDAKVITKCTALATVAYTCYMYGYLFNISKIIHRRNMAIPVNNKSSYLVVRDKSLVFLSLAFFLLYYAVGGIDAMRLEYTDNVLGGGGPLVTYSSALLTIIPVLLSFVLWYRYNNLTVLVGIALSLPFLLVGSRTLPLSIALGLYYFISLHYKISNRHTVLFLILGLVALSIVGTIRSGDSSDMEGREIGVWSYFLDLFVCNRNLFESYEYVQNSGVLWGLVFVGPILSCLPFAQSIFCEVFNVKSYYLLSSSFITYSHFGGDAKVGLGTNIVGDVYMGGGFIAVVVLFYALGYFVSKSLIKMKEERDFKWTILYLSLLTNAVFLCRGSFFGFAKNFVWVLVIVWITQYIGSRRRVRASI